VRSPNYASIGLGVAVERAREIYDKEGPHSANIKTITEHWGFASPRTGPASGTFSALIKYGLLEGSGRGHERSGRLTDLAMTILRAPDSDERTAAIRIAALHPALNRELWDELGGDLPSIENLRWKLESQRHFSPSGATEFEQAYRATLGYAGLLSKPDSWSATNKPDDAASLAPAAATDALIGLDPPVPGSSDRTDGARTTALSSPGDPATRIPILVGGGQQIVVEGTFPVGLAAWQTFTTVLEAMKPGLVVED